MEGETFFCPFRQKKVPFLPEEKVRSHLLTYLEKELGYPKGLMLIEKTIEELPLVFNTLKPPLRRIDLVVFYKKEDALLPLVLVECKSGSLKKEAFRQVEGYNYFIKAPFMACVSEKEIKFWGEGTSCSFFPPYKELIGFLV